MTHFRWYLSWVFLLLSAEDSKIFYGISSNATDAAAKIKDQYNVAESQQTICINNAETVYVTQTTSTYEELNSCLKNGYVSTPGPTTPFPTAPTISNPTTTPYPTTTTWSG